MNSSEFLVQTRKLGITDRQIKNWIHCGYLQPEDPYPGKGNYREWSENELRIVRVIAHLMNVGFTLTYAQYYARNMIKSGSGFLDLDNKCSLIVELPT